MTNIRYSLRNRAMVSLCHPNSGLSYLSTCALFFINISSQILYSTSLIVILQQLLTEYDRAAAAIHSDFKTTALCVIRCGIFPMLVSEQQTVK